MVYPLTTGTCVNYAVKKSEMSDIFILVHITLQGHLKLCYIILTIA